MRLAGAFTFTTLLVSTAVLASCSSAPSVGNVYAALDGDGTRTRGTFYTDTTAVYCVAEYSSGRKDVTVESLIRQKKRYDAPSDSYIRVDRVLTTQESVPGVGANQKISVSLPKPPTASPTQTMNPPYEVGTYDCEIRTDGTLAGTYEFSIEFPPCPDATIPDQSACGGFYQANSKCPAFGATSQELALCTCGSDGKWSCK